jgi:hypothetical protein
LRLHGLSDAGAAFSPPPSKSAPGQLEWHLTGEDAAAATVAWWFSPQPAEAWPPRNVVVAPHDAAVTTPGETREFVDALRDAESRDDADVARVASCALAGLRQAVSENIPDTYYQTRSIG